MYVTVHEARPSDAAETRRLRDNVPMAITRRKLATIIAAAAAVPAAAQPQAPDEETRSAQEALRNNALQLDKIPLPMATEPAFHFKA